MASTVRVYNLIGGWTNPSEKYALQAGSFFLEDQGEKYLNKPPPFNRESL